MTKTYKFNDKIEFGKSSFKLASNIKIVIVLIALLMLVGALDLSMIQVVSESAKFI